MHKKDTSDSTRIEITKIEIDTATTSKTNNGLPPAPVVVNVAPAEIHFKFLRIKSKVNYSNNGEEQSFPVTAHIEKDNKIWLSIVVGLEVARGLITRDSIIFIDRIHRTYYKYDFASLSKEFNFNLSFDLVQSLLIGNMPIKKREADEVSKQEGGYMIKQKENFAAIDNFISEQNLKLQNLTATDSSGTSKMQVDYSNFLAINEILFPQEIIAKIDAQRSDKVTQTLINLQHNRIEFLNESPGFTFSIPKAYSPK